MYYNLLFTAQTKHIYSLCLLVNRYASEGSRIISCIVFFVKRQESFLTMVNFEQLSVEIYRLPT